MGERAFGTVNTVTVRGSGRASQPCERASFTARVEATDDDSKVAYDQATKALNSLVDALIEAGATKDEIVSSGVSLSPEWDWEDTGENRKRRKHFDATGSLSVTTDEARKASACALAAAMAGASWVSDIEFELKDDGVGIEMAALAEAMADARRRAEILANGAGRTLGVALEASAGQDETYSWRSRAASDVTSSAVNSRAASYEPAYVTEKVVSACETVTVTFELV